MNLTNGPEQASIVRSASRASARSGRSSRTSTLSRNQSLIKKNIELQDLKPADVLIERFVAWKAIVKQLSAYFEGIADIENNTAKELTKLAGVIQVPFRAGNQFLGEGGLQDVYYDIRDKTRIIADQHADLGRTIDSSIVQHLQKLRAEIKAHIKNVQNDTGKLAAGVARERELSTKLVGELANAISTFKNTPMNIHPKSDPYVANQAVHRQLSRQVLEENLLQKSIVMMQQNSAHFEEGIVKSIQSAWQTFDEWQSRSSAASQEIFRSLASHMATIAPDREWIQFAARSDHLLDPDTPLRDPELIKYPLKDDPSVVPVHVGHLERKKRFTRSYTESFFVLTPAGFLHEYATSDPTQRAGQSPTFSLFLPSCTLGPPSGPRSSAHKFHIEGRKDGLGTTKSGSFKGILGGEGNKAWNFRARSRDDMMEWWNDIRMLCARYLVASEQVDRTGPVEEAVRSIGYNSEDMDEFEEEEEEEEEELAEERMVAGDESRLPAPIRTVVPSVPTGAVRDDDDGSSVEEEAEDSYEEPPVYSHQTGSGAPPLEIGPNGYALEKKQSYSGGVGADAGPPSISYHSQPLNAKYHATPNFVARNSLGDVRSQHAVPIEVNGSAHGNVDGGDEEEAEGQRLERRLSKRQMEKAPAAGEVSVGRGRQEGRLERGTSQGMDLQQEPRTGNGLPPPIQLHDPGFVKKVSPPPETATTNMSTRAQVHDEEEEEEQSAARASNAPVSGVDGDTGDEEDMYVNDVTDAHPTSAAGEPGDVPNGTAPTAAPTSGGPAPHEPSPGPALQQQQSEPSAVEDSTPQNQPQTGGKRKLSKKDKKRASRGGMRGVVDSVGEAIGLGSVSGGAEEGGNRVATAAA